MSSVQHDGWNDIIDNIYGRYVDIIFDTMLFNMILDIMILSMDGETQLYWIGSIISLPIIIGLQGFGHL